MRFERVYTENAAEKPLPSEGISLSMAFWRYFLVNEWLKIRKWKVSSWIYRQLMHSVSDYLQLDWITERIHIGILEFIMGLIGSERVFSIWTSNQGHEAGHNHKSYLVELHLPHEQVLSSFSFLALNFICSCPAYVLSVIDISDVFLEFGFCWQSGVRFARF